MRKVRFRGLGNFLMGTNLGTESLLSSGSKVYACFKIVHFLDFIDQKTESTANLYFWYRYENLYFLMYNISRYFIFNFRNMPNFC